MCVVQQSARSHSKLCTSSSDRAGNGSPFSRLPRQHPSMTAISSKLAGQAREDAEHASSTRSMAASEMYDRGTRSSNAASASREVTSEGPIGAGCEGGTTRVVGQPGLCQRQAHGW